jgi:hypothetical protein
MVVGAVTRHDEGGFVLKDAFTVVTRLQKISSRHADQAVAVLQALLTNPLVDHWAYVTQREAIRDVLKAGLTRGTAETVTRAKELISFLSTIGETSYIDLVRPSTA